MKTLSALAILVVVIVVVLSALLDHSPAMGSGQACVHRLSNAFDYGSLSTGAAWSLDSAISDECWRGPPSKTVDEAVTEITHR